MGWVQNFRRSLVRKTVRQGKGYYEYLWHRYPDYLNEGNAMSFVLERAKKWCVGRGLDIGASRWPFPGAVPVQNDPDQNAHKLDKFPDGSQDFVFSSHCLEHLDDWQGALRLWVRKIRPGGRLFLYLPHRSMRLWRPGSVWVGSEHRWSPSYQMINPFLEKLGMKVLDLDKGWDAYWSFFIVAEKKE